ncbi:MAG: polysaccharide deacetylase family protein [Candidatus Mcinerneyibacterium aminivorans]|uniref:Polysaccharide deacetylase family protein n=1 Tax=Candidatus Mcinerneyibacterium aminivorans TaxID=2703815 RepID=A0A5D0MJ90_9BACT|nr:MAG: polysaccharide deacetylase family protein [Candidatus Mcinerneyibacterium aminivorans]
MIAEIITVLLSIYLIINIITFFPYSRYFYKNVFYLPQKDYLITVDDGPTKYTEQMIKLLQKHDQRAIFFLNGEKLSGFEETVKKIEKEGHEIGNHSYKHYFFNPLLSSVIINNLKINEEKLKKYTDRINYVRTPHGYQTPGLMKYLKSNNKKFVYWDTIMLDFIPFIPLFLLKFQVNRFINKKGILCLHSNKKSVKILRYVLTRIGDDYE